MGLAMTIYSNVQTPLTDSTMLTQQCKDYNAKIVGPGVEGHGFAFAKYEISHLLQWPQKHFTQHHVKPSSPHRAHNEKGGFP